MNAAEIRKAIAKERRAQKKLGANGQRFPAYYEQQRKIDDLNRLLFAATRTAKA